MKRRPRIYYTESQKALMWDHWQKGSTGYLGSRIFGVSVKTNHCLRALALGHASKLKSPLIPPLIITIAVTSYCFIFVSRTHIPLQPQLQQRQMPQLAALQTRVIFLGLCQ